MAKSRIWSAISILVLLFTSLFLVLFATFHHTAWADTTVGNTTETPTAPPAANFNLPTAAVVTFVLVLIGLAASLLLMVKYANSGTWSE